ncbi:hypothetical protein XENOCAPTIV_020846, partial [Xenoophorus captivus]
MLVRVTDKFPNVRIQAALAMTRLQQPKDPDCPTINGLFLLKRFTLKRLPSHRELVYCSRVSMTLQVMF